MMRLRGTDDVDRADEEGRALLGADEGVAVAAAGLTEPELEQRPEREIDDHRRSRTREHSIVGAAVVLGWSP